MQFFCFHTLIRMFRMALIVFNNIPASVVAKKNSFCCDIRCAFEGSFGGSGRIAPCLHCTPSLYLLARFVKRHIVLQEKGAGCGSGFIPPGGSVKGQREAAGDDLHLPRSMSADRGSSTAAAAT